MGGAPVDEIVAVDAGENHVAETPARQSFRRVFWLVRIQRWRCPTGLDAAKSAAPRAGIAHEHDRCSGAGLLGAAATAPTVTDVRAAGFFADGVEVQAAEVGLYGSKRGGFCGVGNWSFEPWGKSCMRTFVTWRADEDGLAGVFIRCW